jgi:hypothetical protein
MSPDFTMESYVELLEALAKRDVVSVERFQRRDVREPFAVLRHFVDRAPTRAARMAKVEHKLGLHGTYYFAWDPKLPHTDRGYPSGKEPGGFPAHQVIEARLYGHEVGYLHAAAKGEPVDVAGRLVCLRKLAPAQTGADITGAAVAGPCLAPLDFGEAAIASDAGRSWRLSTGAKPGSTARLIAALPEHPRLVLDVRPRLWTHGKVEKAMGLVGY